MSYIIYENGDCIRIIKDSQFFFLQKRAITAIEVIREDIIKISRSNCLNSIYIRHQDVSFPFAYTPMNLALLINSWVANAPIPPPND